MEGILDTSQIRNRAAEIDLFSLSTMQMRTFHVTWCAFFLAFFGRFGIAPPDGGRSRSPGTH